MNAIEDNAYPGCKVNSGLEEFGEKSLYLKNAVAVEMMEKFIGYWMKWHSDRNKFYVDGTVMHLARLDAWISCVVMTIDIEVRRGGRRQTLFSVSHGRYLHRAVGSVLKMAWEALKDIHAAEFDNDGMGDGKERAMCGNSEGLATVALLVVFAERFYLAVRN